jgi:hypothetical protein
MQRIGMHGKNDRDAQQLPSRISVERNQLTMYNTEQHNYETSARLCKLFSVDSVTAPIARRDIRCNLQKM